MKTKDIKNKTTEDLGKDIVEAKRELFNLRFQSAHGQLTNTARVRTVRRNIAKMKTAQTQLKSN